MALTTRLSEKGQVVIPNEVRTAMGLERGDQFSVEMRGDEVVLKRLPRFPLADLRGSLTSSDDLLADLLESRRVERKRERKRIDA
jgi:AbrB family looped-hinge helix DNA binding protein